MWARSWLTSSKKGEGREGVQGALEKDGSISLTPRFSGVASGSRSFLTVSTVFSVFAGALGTFLDAPWIIGLATAYQQRLTGDNSVINHGWTQIHLETTGDRSFWVRSALLADE